MTQSTQVPPRPDLSRILDDQRWRWLVPFMMTVLSYPPAFQKLSPYVGPGERPDGTPKIEGGAHFWRTIPAILDAFQGLRTEAVERLIAAHLKYGVLPEEVADTVRWLTAFMRLTAADLGWSDLDEVIQEAGLEAGRILNASALLPLSLKEAEGQLRGYFAGLILLPNTREAFWDVVSWDKIQELLTSVGLLTPEDVLVHSEHFLPEGFVRQFELAG